MAAYAEVTDVQARMTRTLTEEEETACEWLLSDAGAIIDAFAPNASEDVKLIVSCRMVIRVLGDGGDYGVPTGATQGSMSALGYSQSWALASGSAAGELYLAKLEKQMLGVGNKIGSYSPVEELVSTEEET